MLPTVLPLRMILLEVLILWLAIAVESWFFQRLLKVSPKMSVEYAATMNLFSTCIGWLIFFYLETLLSPEQRELLIAFVLLGQWEPISAGLILIALLIFLLSFFGKLQGLQLLRVLLVGHFSQSRKRLSATIYLGRLGIKTLPPVSAESGALLVAHTFSHLVILLVLFIQSNN